MIFIAHVDVRDLDLQVFNDLSDKLFHKSVLFLKFGILCKMQGLGYEAPTGPKEFLKLFSKGPSIHIHCVFLYNWNDIQLALALMTAWWTLQITKFYFQYFYDSFLFLAC